MKKFIAILTVVSIVFSMFSLFAVFADGETSLAAPINLKVAAVSDVAATISFDRPEGVTEDGASIYCDHYIVKVYKDDVQVAIANTKDRTTTSRLSTTYYKEDGTVDLRGYWRRYRAVVVTGLEASTSYTATVTALNKDETISSLESEAVSFTTSPSRSENKDVLVSLGASFTDDLKASANVYSYQMGRVENLVNGVVGKTKEYYSGDEWNLDWLDCWFTNTTVTDEAPLSATIDIGTPCVLSKIEVVNPLEVEDARNVSEYKIYLGTTTDNMTLYTTVTDNATVATKTINIDSKNEYRYVKIEVTKGFTGNDAFTADNKVRLCELKVYSGQKQEGLGSLGAAPANATIAAKSDNAATITFDYVSSGYDGYYVFLNNDYTKPYVTTTDLYNIIVVNNLLPNTEYLASVVGYKNDNGTITMTNPAEVTFTTEEARFYKAGVNVALGADISGETSTTAPIERAVNGVYGKIGGNTANDQWSKYGVQSGDVVEKTLTLNLKNVVKISSVKVVQPSAYGISNQDATSFVVYGSTNGDEYTQIAAGSGANEVAMDVTNTTAFKYIQVKVTKENPSNYSFRIGDIMVYSAGDDVNKVLSYDVNYTEDEENDTLSVDLTYVNATSETQNFVAILALYNNDNELINAVNLPNLNIASKQSGKISLPCSYAGHTLKYAKTFIWKGMDNIVPIASVYEYAK